MSREKPVSNSDGNSSPPIVEDVEDGSFSFLPDDASLASELRFKLSKAGKRRFNKEIRELRETFETNPALFERRWNQRVQGWLHEVHRRAKNWAEGEYPKDSDTRERIIERGRTHVFGVVKIAVSVILACGREIRSKVEKETLQTISNECTKAVAGVVDARLNNLIGSRHKRIRR